MVDLTVVQAIDSRTLEQFRWSVATWRRNRPELWDHPWLFLYDRSSLSFDAVERAALDAGLGVTDVRAVPWPPVPAIEYPTQRERMLTAFIHAARWVETDWWVKIDTDAVALRPADWAPDDWFRRDPDAHDDPYLPYAPGYFAWIASAWGYTKPGDQMARLDDWADDVPELADLPRLDIPYTPGARRCRHPRMASWVSFYRTDWTCWASGLASRSVGEYRAPVPSQDGFHFYVAARTGVPTLRTSMRKRGWTNCPKLAGLVKTVSDVLRGET